MKGAHSQRKYKYLQGHLVAVPADIDAFLGLVVVPATTIAAAIIGATGSVMTAAIWADVINTSLNQTIKEQERTRALIEQSLPPRPKFF